MADALWQLWLLLNTSLRDDRRALVLLVVVVGGLVALGYTRRGVR